jgi:two-component system chemotaxis response regulator CheB
MEEKVPDPRRRRRVMSSTGSERLGVPGHPTGLSCPHCGGVLGERTDGNVSKLECRIGHVVLVEALLDAKATAVEDALWASVRALHEKAALTRRLSQRAERHGDLASAEQLRREADVAERRADIVQDILVAAEH